MKKLNEFELTQVTGGAGISYAVLKALLIAGGVIFGIGVIDGYVRPLRCR